MSRSFRPDAGNYRWIDAAQLRASAHFLDIAADSWPEHTDTGAPNVESEWGSWLREAWSAEGVAVAVTVASPSLAAEISTMWTGATLGIGRGRRLSLALARYLIRMRGRATPFGLFAGVAPLHFGRTVEVEWTDLHSIRTRPDALWWAGVVNDLESHPDIAPRLNVVRNDFAICRGDRIVIPAPNRAGAVQVSIRRTEAVDLALSLAAAPTEVAMIVDKVGAKFPDSGSVAVQRMVAELLRCGILISCLRPGSTEIDPRAHLSSRLDAMGVAVPRGVSAASQPPIRRERSIDAYERVDDPERWAVDLGLGARVTLPTAVAREIETAADALIRLSPFRSGHPDWCSYHYRFLDHYGVGAYVSLDLLLDPVSGLGFPDHFTARTDEPPPTARDEALLRMAQHAALAGSQEVILEAADIDALDPGPSPKMDVAHLDLSAELQARSADALEAGEFQIVVVGVGRSGLATSGRFLDLLAPTDVQRAVDALRGLPTKVAGAVPVQLAFAPVPTRVGNVARVTQVLPTVLSVGEYRSPSCDDVQVRDLQVSADHAGLYLIDRQRGVLVEPVVANAVARHAMPPLVRFLAELSRATSSALSQFSWGLADVLPFRPRLRHGRCVLSAARWRIDLATLPRASASQASWEAAFARQREHLQLPDVVAVGTGDRRLRLDLTSAMELDILREHLAHATGPVTVAEAATVEEWGWFGGRAHEIVVPLARRGEPSPAPAAVLRHRSRPPARRGDGIVPGSWLVSARLRCHPEVMNMVLGTHLQGLLADLGPGCPWWFVRVHTPQPELRLRLPTERYGVVTELLGAWVADLRRRGLVGDLVLDTYRPETARYTELGDSGSMAAAEAVFAADSVAAYEQMRALTVSARQLDPLALAAASVFDLACALTGDRHSAARWLVRRADLSTSAPLRDRGRLDQVRTLCSSDASIAALPEKIRNAWQTRAQSVAHYRRILTPRSADDEPAECPRDSIVVSLLHLHHVRALGPDADREARVFKLARAAALALLSRKPGQVHP